MSKPRPVLLFVVIALVFLALFGWHYCTAHTAGPADLAKLKNGMDWVTAEKILGVSESPYPGPHGTYVIGLRKQDRWCMVDITLDSSFRIISIFHDH